uniref:Uncharacterized protein n=1 Tax=Ditylenchus dipsaci TaxID=166011 RepID=A0A915DWD6_9BILA
MCKKFNVSQSQEVTVIGQIASIPKKRMRTIRKQHDFELELKGALQKLSDPHVEMMVKMLEPLGDYEIYLIHAFFFYSTVMIGQHKIVHVDQVSDLLAGCVKLGFPLHLSSLEINYKMIEEVHNKVKEFGGFFSDPKISIWLEQDEDCVAENTKDHQAGENEVSTVETCAAELGQSLSLNTNAIQYNCAMMAAQHENVPSETAKTMIPSCGSVIRSVTLPYHDPAAKKIRVNDQEY